MFDYSWVVEETRKEFEAVLSQYKEAFLKWRNASVNRQGQTLEVAFSGWWMQRGPTAFRTTVDSLRFRKDLLAFIGTE